MELRDFCERVYEARRNLFKSGDLDHLERTVRWPDPSTPWVTAYDTAEQVLGRRARVFGMDIRADLHVAPGEIKIRCEVDA